MASALALLGSLQALADDSGAGWLLREPIAVEWRAAESLPPGAKIAVLEGDPEKEGFFTMRIKMLDGYRVAWMTGETVLQLSSIGPWTITYVRPEDDPRSKGR